MKADALFRMPLLVVVALWLLHRRAAKRCDRQRQVSAEPVHFGDELVIFEHVEVMLAAHGSTWMDRALLQVVSGRRRDAARLASFGWMVVGKIPRGEKAHDNDR
jgi:hypothetical protein